MSEIGVTAGPAAPDKARSAAIGSGQLMPHYVSTAPFDAYSVDAMTPAQERFYRAPPLLLMWWRLRRHRVAVASGIVLLALYVMILFSEFLAPYHLHTRSTITRYERPTIVGADVVGDLRGRGLWTLTPRDGGTDVQFDWRVIADKPILRVLTPVLRPLFRWNHAWAIARAQEGLEPYARSR